MANLIQLTLQEAEDALYEIDANLPYYVDKEPCWSRVGRALFSEFGDSAFAMFDAWSAQGSSYDAKLINYHWKNFRGSNKVGFGSFISIAMDAGWKPRKEELSESEKKERANQYNKHKAETERKQKQIQKEQWTSVAEEEVLFNRWPAQFSPTQYQLKKQMADVSRFVDVRLGRDKYNKPCLVWPIYEDLFNQGRFCGFERILDKGFKIGDKLINKLSSDNSFTNVGFCTFGKQCDRGPERIWVVGGFADAYSAHVSTGEVIITPIGEGNIPALIERLSKKHPDIQFIAAPDNDTTGRKMAEAAGCFWTLPTTDGYDWSDVYINEGREAVAAQLLNVKGFQTVESNSRYLQAEIKRGLNLIDSGMGTGKSTNVKDFIKKNPHLKTLIISHRVALAQSLKSGLASDAVSVEFYQDLVLKDVGPGIDTNMALRDAHILVCSVDSLWRLAGSNWDAVFVDEVEQNLGQYFAKTIQYGEDCLNYLTFALTNSQYQILADAHLGALTYDFCNRIGLHSGVLYDNQFKIAEGKKLFVYESKHHLMEEVMQQIMSKGKRYIYANSKDQVKNIATAIEQSRERKHYHGKVLVVHADVTSTDEVKEALNDINSIVPELDVLIASPTLGTGFDIKSNAHQFDKTIGFLSSNVGSSEEGHQGLNRARDIQEFHVFLDPAERSEPTDPTYIQNKLIEEVSTETMKVLSIDPTTGEFASRNPLYEWLYCKVKAKQNESRNRYKARFLKLAKADGYEVINVAKQKLAAKFGEEVSDQARYRNNRVAVRELLEAPVHVGEAFKTVMANGENFTAEEIAKSKVVYDLHLDAANDEQLETLRDIAKDVFDEYSIPGENVKWNKADEAIEFPESMKEAVATALTFKQSKNRFVDAIKKLTWVNVNEHTAKLLDVKDVQHAESRVSWRHLSIKRAHLIKMLQVAGIDEQLNYNGKQWTAEELSKELSEWLRTKKTKDRLFKYSGITVTANTLSDPVKWLNNHLRSFGVPVISGAKKRVNGKAVNAYSVDQDDWEAVKTLVSLRSAGIEEGVQDVTAMDPEVLQRSVAKFIQEINANEFKQGYNVQFAKLDDQCQLLGMMDLRDELAATFSKIAHLFDDQKGMKNDPLVPIVINKQFGTSGSPILHDEASCDGGSHVFEGGEKGSPLEFPTEATTHLSDEHRALVNEVANIAVNKHELPADKVMELMEKEGLEVFSGNAEAWAGSIRDILVGEVW